MLLSLVMLSVAVAITIYYSCYCTTVDAILAVSVEAVQVAGAAVVSVTAPAFVPVSFWGKVSNCNNQQQRR